MGRIREIGYGNFIHMKSAIYTILNFAMINIIFSAKNSKNCKNHCFKGMFFQHLQAKYGFFFMIYDNFNGFKITLTPDATENFEKI